MADNFQAFRRPPGRIGHFGSFAGSENTGRTAFLRYGEDMSDEELREGSGI
ncbi:MAG: hypothetical protein V2I97_09370 [Desulfococcaceae bacterium]|jgi:hypothetical protein|nr:hypothetical protein [Desulfococcaceae bacterium]